MRILHVTISFPPNDVFGAEKVASFMAETQSQNGHQIGVVTSGHPGKQANAGIKIYNINRSNNKYARKALLDYYNPFNKAQFKAALQDFKPDIIHFHHIYGFGSSLIQIAKAYAPTIVTIHDYWPICFNSTQRHRNKPCKCTTGGVCRGWTYHHRYLHRKNLEGVLLTTPSEYMAGQLQKFLNNKIKVISNGVTIPSETTTYKREILSVGRIVKEKGIHIVAKYLTKAVDKGWEVNILGEGDMRQEIKASYPTLNLPGYKGPKSYYQKASIMIVPSIWPEPFGIVITEAMSYGIPVIAASSGGITEILSHGGGILYPPDKPELFGEALSRLTQDPELVKTMGQQGRKIVEEKYSWDKINKTYEVLYKGLMRP